ncbi:PEP-CTERM sorting domain-containing protein [Akkermansiaceae bacterium]|nr:PEP-CTERM sorting domain-containing protein [Akkermansiaceae bacterium]MDB4419133.1 PEP-CTERM sorting domain-containing protein [bacterium]MDB4435944.1 PEP-CTERM sorting domain-containing protein [Akkermansiaceae bacterium]MDB4541295.1 PEP-CTERM sorting domain-containing protein [Akkermansiaceae bacterium]
MKFKSSFPLLICISPLAHAASTQIGDLRLPSNTYSGSFTYFDSASGGDLTRAVSGAPVPINSTFTAITQNPDGGTPSTTEDIGLRTFTSATQIRTINRFAASTAPSGGTRRVGGVQWTINLSSLSGYLTSNSLSLTALDLGLNTSVSDATKEYDVYLSYTNPTESITIAGLSTGANSGSDNFDNVWFPAFSSSEGSIVGGTHKIVELGHSGVLTSTIDLLPLYNAGVENVNLSILSGDFFSGRTLNIDDGSGLSIDTAPIPEPATSLFSMLAALGVLRRRR